ncbi:hypothetical protein FWH30_01035 [Microgenomates group bacterium]|nr:hypothetical protein [Microgenomates group bacterium]
MQELILVDLDRTLFDTESWHQALSAAMSGETPNGPDDLIDYPPKSFLYPDAESFISKFDFTIFTYGEESWQRIKIKVSKLTHEVLFAETEDKTKLIELMMGSGKYSRVVLIDDKLKNFKGYEKLPNATGFLVDRRRRFINDRMPSNVTRIESLEEITSL